MPAHRFKKLKLGIENPFGGTMGFEAQFWGEYIYAIQSDEIPTVSVFDALDKSNASGIHNKMKISRNYDTFCPAKCGIGEGKNNPRIYFGGTSSTNLNRRTHSFINATLDGFPYDVFGYYLGGVSGNTQFNEIIAFRSSTDDIYGYTVGNPILYKASTAFTGFIEAPDLQIYLVYAEEKITDTWIIPRYYWCVRSVMNDYYNYWYAEYGGNVYSEDDDTGEEEGDDDMIDIPTPSPNFAISSGMMKLYRLTLSDCNNLASDMWNKNMWSEAQHWFGENPPYEAIVSLGVVPYCPDSGTILSWGNHTTIKLAGHSLPTAEGYPITNPVYRVDFPEKTIGVEYGGSFLDYEPYTTVQANLPFIGWINLPSQFVVGHTIRISYIIDALSGGLNAFIANETTGVFAMHSASCMYTIPTSTADGGRLLDGIMTAATAGIELAGSGSITTTGALKTGNVLQHAFDTSVNMKGSSSGSMGWCTSQNIAIYVHRPKVLDYDQYAPCTGYPTARYMELQTCKGFTQVDSINLEGVPATKGELESFEAMLKTGIVIPATVSQPSYSTGTANRITLDIYSRTGCIHEVNKAGAITTLFTAVRGAFRTGDTPSITNPSIVVNMSFTSIALANYVHIAEFNRFYHIENMIALTAETTLLILSSDVLNSFWNNAKGCYAYVARQGNDTWSRSKMIDDKVVTGCLDGSTVDDYEIENPYPDARQYVVACAGS